MKKLLILAIALCSTFTAMETTAQTKKDKNPNFAKMDLSPMDIAISKNAQEVPVMRVLYSRPQKRDRTVFGKLVPYGRIWRTGANEATEVTLYNDMRVGDKIVKVGSYSLYTIPEENEWTVILNRTTNTWGAYDYEETKDVVRIKTPVRKTTTPIEAFSMVFEPMENGTNLVIGWDDRYVKIPFHQAP